MARLASNYGRRSVAPSTLHGPVIKNVIKETIFNGACEKLKILMTGGLIDYEICYNRGKMCIRNL